MGEARKRALRVDFDRRLKLEFHGAKITSDAGLLAYRELDDTLGLTQMADDFLDDPRTGHNVLHTMTALLRQAVFGRLTGYEDTNDAEQRIKEGNQAIRWTRLSCHDFRDNEVRLQLFALAYNLGNFLRSLALPKKIAHWSMTTLREKLIKIGAKVVSGGRYVRFQMAEVAVSRRMFSQILKNIAKLRPPPAWT